MRSGEEECATDTVGIKMADKRYGGEKGKEMREESIKSSRH